MFLDVTHYPQAATLMDENERTRSQEEDDINQNSLTVSKFAIWSCDKCMMMRKQEMERKALG
jgi:hypothetical protein